MLKICQNSRKNSKLKGKTQNSRWKLEKSALLGSLDAGKASKKKPVLMALWPDFIYGLKSSLGWEVVKNIKESLFFKFSLKCSRLTAKTIPRELAKENTHRRGISQVQNKGNWGQIALLTTADILQFNTWLTWDTQHLTHTQYLCLLLTFY